MLRHRNLGKFKVTSSWLNNNIKVVEKLMCECVPIKTTHDLSSDTIEYTAISNHFRVLDEGEKIPLYDCLISPNKEDGSIGIEFKEIKADDRELFDLLANYPTI
jgi:hypothetical protein